jgi:hypothetical protein
MKMRTICGFVLSLLFVGIPGLTFGQSYACSLIPDSLKKNANAVVREHSSVLDIQSERKATWKEFDAITVLNKKGEQFGLFMLEYDKFITPDNIRIIIYDALGNQIKKVKQGEIIDHSYIDDGTLFSDDRIKAYKPVANQYPYTITCEFELHYNGYLGLHPYLPVEDFGLSIEHSMFSMIAKPGVSYRFHEMHFDSIHASIVHTDSINSWEIKGYPALVEEPMSIDVFMLAPVVWIAPNSFEYDGSGGDYSSWESFGSWISGLLKGRNLLPEETRHQVYAMTDTIQGNYEKARRLYEYMQSKVRYVGIQLGIGGYQPFSAETVDKLGYGDCKALSNYYLALLNEAGIPALYAVTKMKEGNCFFLQNFPANIYFNHAIVCIPMQKDSVWVECTNNFIPFGQMSEGVAGHPSLLVTGSGGKIVFVPSGVREDSKRCRNYQLQLNSEGNALLDLQISFTGFELANGLQHYVRNQKEREEYLYKYLDMNDIVIDKYNCAYHKATPSSITLEAEINCSKYGTCSGNRMFLPLTQGGAVTEVPEKANNKKFPFSVDKSTNDRDTLSMILPEGFITESLPASFHAETKFGKFYISTHEANGIITVVRSLEIYKSEYPAREYIQFRDFMISIQRAEKQKIVLKTI